MRFYRSVPTHRLIQFPFLGKPLLTFSVCTPPTHSSSRMGIIVDVYKNLSPNTLILLRIDPIDEMFTLNVNVDWSHTTAASRHRLGLLNLGSLLLERDGRVLLGLLFTSFSLS